MNLRKEGFSRDRVKLQLDKLVTSFSRSGVKQKMKHVLEHLEKVGMWLD